jgi:hypothetical protein
MKEIAVPPTPKYQTREDLIMENGQLRITVNELMNRISHINTHGKSAAEKLGLLRFSRSAREHLKAIILMSTIVQKQPAPKQTQPA